MRLTKENEIRLKGMIEDAFFDYSIGLAKFLADQLGYPEEEIRMLINEFNYNKEDEK